MANGNGTVTRKRKKNSAFRDREGDDGGNEDDDQEVGGMGTQVAPGKDAAIVVTEPNLQIAVFEIIGTAPYVQSKFSQKAIAIMREVQALGSVASKGKKKEPKDFDALYEGAIHYSRKEDGGWPGIPANGLRAALVDACRTVGWPMTKARMSVFVEADGFDASEGTPLVKITHGKPRHVEHAVRIQNTTDIRVRAMWDPGWRAKVKVRYDADQFRPVDVANLLMRVGIQVGIGEGRPFSKSSSGMGWGTFALAEK